MNKAESNAFQILFEKAGWTIVNNENEADIVLLNTCSVRNKAEERIWGRIGHYRFLKKNKPIKLIITGCMAERLKESFKQENPTIDIVIGNFQKHNLVSICENALMMNDTIQHDGMDLEQIGPGNPSGIYTGNGDYIFPLLHENKTFKAFVPIMHGCNNFCTYCIVPYVRGPEISRSPSEILSEISVLDSQNIKEITLLGQNVNSYLFSQNSVSIDFSKILELIIEKRKNIKWIRFLTSHPKDFPFRLIDMISENTILCNHIHLPIQHGADPILKKMNRGYTVSYYMNIIESIKKKISDAAITSDILIGFPGETKDDFAATLTLMKEIEFDEAFMYRYSLREGTKAASFEDDVPEVIKLERLAQVIALQQTITEKKKRNKIGRDVEVLVEGKSKKEKEELLGRTEYNDMVVFPGDSSMIGRFLRVNLESLHGNTFKGRELLCLGD